MSDHQLEEKQRYLRENILQKEYDPEQFMDFCSEDKGSVDIAAWTLSELKDDQDKIKKNNYNQGNNFSYSDKKHSDDSPEKSSQFDNWGDFVGSSNTEAKPPAVGLNLVDLDFLEAMGMSAPSSSISSTTVAPKKQEIKKDPFSNDPFQTFKPVGKADFLNNIKDQNFITAYNKTVLEPNSSIQPNSQLNNPIEQKKQQPKISANQTAISSKKQIYKPERDYTTPSENFVKEIKCKNIRKNKIPDNLICTVTNNEIVNPNVFVPKYVLYTITSTPLNVSVKRRMKDFEQLRNLLKKMFPTTQIPHLERYSRLSQTEPHVITKQKLYIESFLNSLLMNPCLKCRILEDFLLCTDLEILKKVLREYNKMDRPKGVQQLWTTAGFVQLDTNTANRKYMNQQMLYVDYVESTFGKLKTLYDQLTIYYQNTAKVINQISNIYDQFKQTTKVVNLSFPENFRFDNIQLVTGQVSKMHKQISDSLQTQAKIFQSQIRHMYKYQTENISTIRETLKCLSYIYQTYQKRTDKDSAAKQSYESKKLGQYKIGAEIPSKNITVLKHQSAYAQNQFKDQTQRYMDELSKKIGAKFQIFSTLQVSIAGDMDIIWRDFQQFIQSTS